MEHEQPHAERPEPSGSQIRAHWATWQWFTGMTKIGIVVVTIVVAATVFLVTRCYSC